ncbi:OmpP1/FadL family transporter [Sulfurimonas sp.]|uniref:OmpP1/FadL family transporter n=1 Tax=Sulfurimonas sp. TaxID=2022749 RepID=UPI002AB2BA0F|nr:outer membrane protein transport protein [Sulfurimonas sp.]
MKRTIRLAVVAALALGATSAFATNGDHMIGLSADSRALGGTGVAMFTGSANALTNPALVAKTKSNSEFNFGGTIFMPKVSSSSTKGAVGAIGTGVDKTSNQQLSMIPVISLSHRINDKMVFSLGMFGTAGMGTDYRGSQGVNNATGNVDLYNMRSSLMLMQFAPSLAYGTDTFGVGVTGIAQYGTLSIDFDQNPTTHIGNGPSDDYGFGFQLGAYYNPMKALTIGAVYKSSIEMNYRDQISKAAAAFGYGANVAGGGLAAKGDELEQPAEYGIGIAYDMDKMTYTMDFKQIQWGDAKGYKDFGWENQTVYALGVRYKTDKFWLGGGFNYGKNPIPDNKSTKSVAGGANTDGDTMNMFNYVMFPATVESTITFGGGYSLSKNLALDMAFTYAPETSNTVSAKTVGAGDITTKHQQTAITVAAKFEF